MALQVYVNVDISCIELQKIWENEIYLKEDYGMLRHKVRTKELLTATGKLCVKFWSFKQTLCLSYCQVDVTFIEYFKFLSIAVDNIHQTAVPLAIFHRQDRIPTQDFGYFSMGRASLCKRISATACSCSSGGSTHTFWSFTSFVQLMLTTCYQKILHIFINFSYSECFITLWDVNCIVSTHE